MVAKRKIPVVEKRTLSRGLKLLVQPDLFTPQPITGQDSNCERCSNWESAESVCLWGSGSKRSKIMIILEYPNSQEDKLGKTLQGKSGKLFNELLEGAGIDKKDCYITYLLKCKPPEGVSPSAADIKVCKEYLDLEIATVQPEIIVTLGATALKAMTRKAKITELHGQTLEYISNKLIIKLVPTFHPNMALRDPSKIAPLRKDINRVGFLLRGQEIKEESLHWEVIRTLDDWNNFIEEYSDIDRCAVDVETTGLDMYAPEFRINSIQFGLPTGRNFALPLSVRDGPWRDKPKARQQFIETVIEIAEDNDIEISGQNFKFDNKCLMTEYGTKFYLRFDTMLAHHTLDENSSHGLKEMATEFCNAPSYDIPLKDKLGLGDLKKFYKYGCFDTGYTMQLRDIFRKDILADAGLRRLFYRLVMPAARMFEKIESSGHYILLDKLAETEQRLEGQKAVLLEEMNRIAGKEINWNSPIQISQLFYEKLKMPVLEKTGKGAPSTGESVLLRLQDKHPLAKLLMDYRGIEKNLSTYVVGWKELMHGEYLYLSTKLHGTVTGRYASRLHQVPRDPEIRSHISAPPGWTFVVADYSQIELRLAAQASGDQRMLQMFQVGGDVHSLTASEILAIPMDKLTKEQRKMAKAVNFGFIYGMWWKKFSIYARDNYGVEVTDEQAQRFRTRFFELYSAFPKWHDRMRRVVRMFGEVVSLSGRKRRLPGVNSSEKSISQEAERQGINSPIQGFGSGDLKAMGMLEIFETFDWDEVRIKGEVHDSVLFWIRTELLQGKIPQIINIMENPKRLKEFNIRMTVPLVVDVEVGPWGLGEKWNG